MKLKIPVLLLSLMSVLALTAFKVTNLKEITNWIQSFVERNGSYTLIEPKDVSRSERDRIEFDGCEATVHVSIVREYPEPVSDKDVLIDDAHERVSVHLKHRDLVNMDILFNLKDIDPDVAVTILSLSGDALPDYRDWIILKTADGYRSIAIRRGTAIASPISVFSLPGGTTREDTQKLADKFHQAITICRDKPN